GPRRRRGGGRSRDHVAAGQGLVRGPAARRPPPPHPRGGDRRLRRAGADRPVLGPGRVGHRGRGQGRGRVTPTVRPYTAADRRWAEGLLGEQMGSARAVRLGEVLEPAALPGLVAEHDGERIGLLTYIVDGDQFEVFSLHCRVENAGAGSALLPAAAGMAAELGCRRLWLLTTNDN